MTDTEMLNWLAERCFYPDDHPNNRICVLVPESIAPYGSFTLNRIHDRMALRAAILQQKEKEK